MLSRAVPAHSLGGMERNSLNLSRALVGKGHAVTLLTTSLPGQSNPLQVEVVDGVNVCYLGGCPPGKYSRAWGRALVAAFAELHRQSPFQIVHGHNSAALYLHWSGALKRARVPLVTTYHDTHIDWIRAELRAARSTRSLRHKGELLAKVAQDLYRLFFQDIGLAQASAAIIAIDDQAIGKIRRQYFVPSSRIHRIYISTDTDLFSPGAQGGVRERFGLRPEQPLLLALGRLVPEKGFQQTLMALPAIARAFPHVHLLIAGDGPQRAELQQLTAAMQVEPHVTFVGPVPHEECPQYFNACDLFVNPVSQTGSYNTTLVEAMACEKVVITSATKGTAILIRDGIDGILVRQGSLDALATATVGILRDPQRARAIGQAARARVLAQFSVTAMVEATIALYEQLV